MSDDENGDANAEAFDFYVRRYSPAHAMAAGLHTTGVICMVGGALLFVASFFTGEPAAMAGGFVVMLSAMATGYGFMVASSFCLVVLDIAIGLTPTLSAASRFELAQTFGRSGARSPSSSGTGATSGSGAFHYSGDGTTKRRMSRREILVRLETDPDAKHLVWRPGWDDWRTVRSAEDLDITD